MRPGAMGTVNRRVTDEDVLIVFYFLYDTDVELDSVLNLIKHVFEMYS